MIKKVLRGIVELPDMLELDKKIPYEEGQLLYIIETFHGTKLKEHIFYDAKDGRIEILPESICNDLLDKYSKEE